MGSLMTGKMIFRLAYNDKIDKVGGEVTYGDEDEANTWEGYSPSDTFSSVFGRVIMVRTGGKQAFRMP